MRYPCFCQISLVITALVVAPAFGAIFSNNSHEIDFTRTKEAKDKSSWSADLDINDKGLGWDGAVDTSRNGWIQTTPIATGLWWRPLTAVNVEVSLDPAPQPFQLANGQTITPSGSNVFARYSPDRKNWSTWQPLIAVQPPDGSTPSKNIFRGFLSVPEREREEYVSLLDAYRKMDVDWASDEEAAVKWILEKHPRFFERTLPFIGYVEFLVESPFHGGQRITSLRANIPFGVGGTSAIPKNPLYKKYQHNGAWRFEALK